MSASILDDLGEEVTGIVAPVSLCMLLTVLLVRVLNPDGVSSSTAVAIAQTFYKEKVSCLIFFSPVALERHACHCAVQYLASGAGHGLFLHEIRGRYSECAHIRRLCGRGDFCHISALQVRSEVPLLLLCFPKTTEQTKVGS